MVTKELLKAELEQVEEEHLDVLYRIIRALASPSEQNQVSAGKDSSREEWKAWVNRMYGSMADDPIERPPQLELEIREPFD